MPNIRTIILIRADSRRKRNDVLCTYFISSYIFMLADKYMHPLRRMANETLRYRVDIVFHPLGRVGAITATIIIIIVIPCCRRRCSRCSCCCCCCRSCLLRNSHALNQQQRQRTTERRDEGEGEGDQSKIGRDMRLWSGVRRDDSSVGN